MVRLMFRMGSRYDWDAIKYIPEELVIFVLSARPFGGTVKRQSISLPTSFAVLDFDP